MNIVRIDFDGGCRGNPGRKYGSYRVHLMLSPVTDVQFLKDRMELGWGTNNEAEFEALIAALYRAQEELANYKIPLDSIYCHVITDSTIVRNRIMGNKKPMKSPRSLAMYALAVRCLDVLNQFDSFKVEWRGRHHNLKIFGH